MRDDARSASLVLDRLYYRAKEVAVLTGLGLRTIYAGVYSGSIPSRKIGNSRLIPRPGSLRISMPPMKWLDRRHLARHRREQGGVENSGILSTTPRVTHAGCRVS